MNQSKNVRDDIEEISSDRADHYCIYCRQGKQILQQTGDRWEEINLEMLKQKQRNWRKFRDDRLVEVLAKNQNVSTGSELEKEAIRRLLQGKQQTYICDEDLI